MKKSESIRYIVRWTQYRKLKTKRINETDRKEKVTHSKSGLYKSIGKFERNEKIFERVTRWKFVESKKVYSKVTKTWNETSYENLLKSEMKKFRKYGKYNDFDASVQKFLGEIKSGKSRIIKGKVSKAFYLKSVKQTKSKKVSKEEIGTRLNQLMDDTENIGFSNSGEFVKIKRKKSKPKKKKLINGRRKA
jgi:hypothetical protein